MLSIPGLENMDSQSREQAKLVYALNELEKLQNLVEKSNTDLELVKNRVLSVENLVNKQSALLKLENAKVGQLEAIIKELQTVPKKSIWDRLKNSLGGVPAEEWSDFCEVCGKEGHCPRDCGRNKK